MTAGTCVYTMMKTGSLKHVPVFCGTVTSCSDFFRASLVFTKSLVLTKKMQNTTRNQAKAGGKKAFVDATVSKMRVAVSLHGDQHLLFRSCPVAPLGAAQAELTKALFCCLLHRCREFCYRSYMVPKGCVSFLRPCQLTLFCCEKFTVWVRVSKTLPAQLPS